MNARRNEQLHKFCHTILSFLGRLTADPTRRLVQSKPCKDAFRLSCSMCKAGNRVSGGCGSNLR
eukprot:6204425-Amphidinium_carterae.1